MMCTPAGRGYWVRDPMLSGVEDVVVCASGINGVVVVRKTSGETLLLLCNPVKIDLMVIYL